MANRIKTVTVPPADRAELERRVRSQTGSARDARRARIVLLAAEGRPAAEIAALVGCSVNTAASWRARYLDRGLAGLDDRPRSGRRVEPRWSTPTSSARCCGPRCVHRRRRWA